VACPTGKKRVGLGEQRLVARKALPAKARHRMRAGVLPDSHPPSSRIEQVPVEVKALRPSARGFHLSLINTQFAAIYP